MQGKSFDRRRLFCLRISDEEHAMLQEAAREFGLSISSLCRLMLFGGAGSCPRCGGCEWTDCYCDDCGWSLCAEAAPAPEKIREAAAAIRATWSERQRVRRRSTSGTSHENEAEGEA